MNDEAIYSLIADERRRLAEVASSWTPRQWATASLARGWQVRDVIAHLTMPFSMGVPGLLVELVRHRGDFDRLADRWARSTAAATSPQELVELLRANAESRFTPPGKGPELPLADLVVHGLDVRLPLGLDATDLDPAALLVALQLASTPVARRFGVDTDVFDRARWEASDLDWSHGTGPRRRAPAVGLIAHLYRQRPLP